MKKIYLAIICIICVYAVSAQSVSVYSFAESAGSYSALGGTNSTATSDDGTQNGIPIGFNFNYGGTVYTQFCITTNGFIKLGNAGVTITTGTPNYTNAISNSNPNSPLIAAFWDDNHRNTGAITYAVSGAPGSHVLSVDWNAVNIGGSGATSSTNLASYRINLYEGSNNIELVYGTMGAAGALTGSIGLNDNTGYLSVTPGAPSTVSSATANNSITSTTNVTGKKFTFSPPPPCTGTPAPGNTISSGTSSCTGGSVTLSLQNSTSGAGVTYQWYSSPDGVSYSPIAGATGTTYTAIITADTYFKADVTCSGGPSTGTSNPVLVTLNTFCTYNTNYATGITYNSISATGSSATFQGTTSGDDNTTTNITLPFTFVFKGTSYNIVNACTNGWLAFGGTAATSYINTLGSLSNGAPAMLAPLWDDLVATGQAYANLPTSFKYQTLGTAPNRVFVAEWIGLETFNNPGPNLNFQVRLYEGTNRIEYVYGTMESYNGTGSTLVYTYSLGLRASATDFISLQKDNSNFFSTATANDALNVLPACNSMYSFDPSGAFTTGTDPGTPAPANDEPAGALTIGVNGAPCSSYCGTYYKTTNATASAGIGTCSAATPGTPDDDVWFKFVATNSVQNISVFGGGGYDAVVQGFSDAGVTSIGCVNATGSGATESLGLTGLTVGATYYIRVYHAGTGNGTTPQISICISAPPAPPANDDPCGAVVLTPAAVCTPYSDNSVNSTTKVTSATTTTQSSAGNPVAAPTCTGAGVVSDVWFKFTATGDTHGLTITPVPGFDVAVQAFTPTGSCAGGNLALTPIGCVNGASTGTAENVVITTTIGNEYYLRVYRHPSGIAGAPVNNSQFSICIYNPTPACTANVTPADLATGVSATPTLTFNRVNFATSYDVYLGTTVGGATLQGNVPDPGTGGTASFNIVTPLSPNTQYFWYVTPKNSNSSAAGCSGTNATSFTTSAVVPPGCVTNIAPANAATGVTSPVNLSWNADAAATSYDVYLGTTNPPTSTIATSVAATNYSWTGAAGSTTYYWYISPKNAGGSATGCSANTTSFTTSAFVCTPIYSTQVCGALGGDSISVFHLQGETVTLDNNSGSYCGDAGTPSYGQYLALPQPDMAAGKAYVGAMTTNPDYDEYASIWIDFNDDANFTANERVLSGLFLPAATTSAYSIYIPAGSPTGAHRMRVRITETSGAIDPCTSLSYGEVEDYMVNIISGPGSPYTVSGIGAGSCTDVALTTINAASNNNNVRTPILDVNGNLVASLNANGNDLGNVTASVYRNTGAVRQVPVSNQYYLDRNISITPATQPASGNVAVRLYYTAAELAALQAADPSNVTGPSSLNVTKVSGGCTPAFIGSGTLLLQTASGAQGSDYYLDVNTPSFSDFFIHGGNIVLPVAIQYLTGSKQGTANYLDWKINCTSAPAVDIALERSADSRHFSPIQTQNATATRCLQDFNYTDVSPLAGINYYRVKITTPDGAFKYSVIVALLNQTKGFELISVAPNPVQSSTVLSVTSVKGGRLDIAVSDVTGKIVMNQTVTIIAGSTDVNMNFSKLSAGTYQISAVNADGDRKTTRFVKF